MHGLSPAPVSAGDAIVGRNGIAVEAASRASFVAGAISNGLVLAKYARRKCSRNNQPPVVVVVVVVVVVPAIVPPLVAIVVTTN